MTRKDSGKIFHRESFKKNNIIGICKKHLMTAEKDSFDVLNEEIEEMTNIEVKQQL